MRITQIAALVIIGGLSLSGVAAAAGEAGNEEKPMASAAAERMAITLPISAAYVPATRPAILPVLYASLGAMQAWDFYSTSAALKAGAHEANPIAAAYAGNTGSMLALKVTSTVSTIFFAERMWKKSRVGAIVLMTAINGATAAVSMHNMRNARVASGR
jgi:Domain of unknown function (DUF5658)